jgi:hypothetical protein
MFFKRETQLVAEFQDLQDSVNTNKIVTAGKDKGLAV